MPLTILLTGFGPFPGAPINPTGWLVGRLARLRRPALSDVKLLPHVFDTTYRAVDRDLPPLLARVKPDAVLMFGLAARTPCLRIETRARNVVSALVPDAAGERLPSIRVELGGPGARLFGAPAARLALAAHKSRVKARVSRDAGRYLCNYLCWRMIETMSCRGAPKFAVFVHVPKLQSGVRPAAFETRKPWRMLDLLRGGEAILLASVVETRRRSMTER